MPPGLISQQFAERAARAVKWFEAWPQTRHNVGARQIATDSPVRFFPCTNVGSTAAPAGSIAAVTSVESMSAVSDSSDNRPLLEINQPGSSGDIGVYAIVNGSVDGGAIAPGGFGSVTFENPVEIAVSGTPGAGAVYGPASGSWSPASSGYLLPALTVLGQNPITNNFLAMLAPTLGWDLGKLTAPLSSGGSATADIWSLSGGSMADSSTSVTVYDWLLNSGQTLASGTKVMFLYHPQSKRRWVFAASCSS